MEAAEPEPTPAEPVPASGRERPAQYVEPEVSRAKFEREISDFHANANSYLGLGWILAEAEFPIVRVVVCAPQLKPPAVVVGVELDYTNYDVEPPSLTLVEPFTGRPYKFEELLIHLKRAVPGEVQVQAPQGLPPGFPIQMFITPMQTLMQPPNDPEGLPFLCVPGVREYHAHPAHSGDSWELHRESGAGRLVRLLEVIYRYGIEPITDYQAQISMNVVVTGFQSPQAPE